jgi:hypothetical protein
MPLKSTGDGSAQVALPAEPVQPIDLLWRRRVVEHERAVHHRDSGIGHQRQRQGRADAADHQ